MRHKLTSQIGGIIMGFLVAVGVVWAVLLAFAIPIYIGFELASLLKWLVQQ